MYNYELKLVNNRGFSWHEKKGVMFKGYLFSGSDFLADEEAAGHILDLLDELRDVKNVLSSLNGVFSAVIRHKGDIYACSDRTRSLPLFYYAEGDSLTITDEPSALKMQKDFDDGSIKVFLHTGYVTGSRTLVRDLFQVEAGSFARFGKEEISKEFYYRFGGRDLIKDNAELERRLTGELKAAGVRLGRSLEGRTAVLPLSSGYDSRLIAVMLKEAGIQDVVAFTYGRKDNPELELSRLTAEKLGFRWMYVEYNDDTVKGFLSSEEFKKYYPFSSAYTSMFYLQEFFALKELAETIPENSVFIPGHSGDTVAGSHLSSEICGRTTQEALTNRILNRHFSMRKLNDKNFEFFKDIISGQLKGLEPSSYTYEDWIIKERHGKFVINSNRIYEYFGYPYRMPLVDAGFLDVMSAVPPDLRLNKKLYDTVLRKYFFEPHGLNFRNETNPEKKDIAIQRTKESVKRMLPKKIINFYKEKLRINTDIYYNIGVTDRMIEDLRSGGVEPDMTGENRNSVIIQWYIQQFINGRI